MLKKAIITLVIVLLMTAQGIASEREPIVIGMTGPITGPSRFLGVEIYRGTSAYVNYVNSRGGIYGRKIKLILYDDGYKSDEAVQNVIRLIEKDKVFALISLTGTEPVTRILPLLKIYEKTGTMLFFPSTGGESPLKPPYGEFVIHYRPTYSDECQAIVDEFIRCGLKRIAVFYQADAYGRSGWYGVRNALDAHKLTIAAEITHGKGLKFSTDMNQQVAYLRSFNPDAVVSVGAYAPTAAFIRDARKAGWDIPIARLSVGSEVFAKMLIDTSKTLPVDITKGVINTQFFPHYYDDKVPIMKEFRQILNKHSQMPPAKMMKENYADMGYTYTSLEGFVNGKLFVDILKALGPDLDKKKMKTTLAKMRNINIGLAKPVSLSQTNKTIYFTTIKNGRIEPLKDFNQWRK